MKAGRNRIVTIDAPIDGLNLISAPNRMPLTQARELTNYVVTDAGIKEYGATIVSNLNRSSARGLAVLTDSTGAETILWSSFDGAVWELRRSTTGSVGNLNGSVSAYGGGTATADIQAGACLNPCNHAGYVFYFSGGVRPGIRVSSTLAETTAFTINGGAVDTPLLSGTSYKGRLYAIEANTTGNVLRYHYSALGAITGPMTAVDLGGVFRNGGKLQAITNWTFNPGNQNDEYLVIASSTGEILVYGGTDPGATNWGLIARLDAPNIFCLRPFVAVGAEMLCVTQRGVVALSQLLAGRSLASPYVNFSRNIKDRIGGSTLNDQLTTSCFIAEKGWAVFPKRDETPNVVYLCNVERGAWSSIESRNTGVGSTPSIRQVVSIKGILVGMTLSPGTLYEYQESITSTERAVWRTPFVGGDSNIQVNKATLQITGGTSFTSKLSGSAAVESIETPEPLAQPGQFVNFDSSSTDVSAVAKPTILEINLNPGGIGSAVSMVTWNQPGAGETSTQEVISLGLWVEDTGSID
jgi:hypothetical protein